MAESFKIEIDIDAHDNTSAATESAKKNIKSVENAANKVKGSKSVEIPITAKDRITSIIKSIKAKGSKSIEIPVMAKDRASETIKSIVAKAKGSKIVQLAVTAKDRASETIKSIVAKAKGSKIVQLAVTAKDRASGIIKSIAAKGSKIVQFAVTANDKASAVVKKVGSGLSSMTSKAWKVTVTLLDKVTAPLRGVMNALTSVQGLVLGTAGAAGGIYAPMKLAGDYQQTEIAFGTLLGGKDNATAFLNEATTFANKTPFEMNDVIQSSKLLSAFGFETRNILPMLTTIGDTASGLGAGADGIDRITRSLGQMYAKGRVQAEEMLQLQELGIPAAKIMQEELGLTAEQVANIGNESISAERAIKALLTGMNKRYGGMMTAQSTSRLGMLSTIKDTFENNFLKQWGEGLWSGIDPILSNVTTWLDENQDKVKQ